MNHVAESARQAGQELAQASLTIRNNVLLTLARLLHEEKDTILAANALDMNAMSTLSTNQIDKTLTKRLILNETKLQDLIHGLQQLANLPDPLGNETLHRELANDLILKRISCPIGVLCIIFEARPEAFIQISSLAIKSGNAVILKGGKEAIHSNTIFASILHKAITIAGEGFIPLTAVQLVTTRTDISELLAQDKYIDVRLEEK